MRVLCNITPECVLCYLSMEVDMFFVISLLSTSVIWFLSPEVHVYSETCLLKYLCTEPVS
jgi:hypothetical protein